MGKSKNYSRWLPISLLAWERQGVLVTPNWSLFFYGNAPKSHFPDGSHTSGGGRESQLPFNIRNKHSQQVNSPRIKPGKPLPLSMEKNQILLPELLPTKGIHCPD